MQGTLLPQDPSQADNSVVALMHGIKVNEGTNGNYAAQGDRATAAGVGQWSNQINGKPVPLKSGQVPLNFQGQAKQFGLDPNDFSPENQNKVMYASIASDKKSGLSPEQILSKWNSGDPNKYLNSATSTGTGPVGPYDVASYVQKGMAAAQQYAQGSQTNTQTPPQQDAPPSLGGFAGNVVKSGANFLGGLGEALLHPIQTVENVGGAAVGGLQELGGQTNDETAKFDALKNYFGQRYGGISNLESTIYKDPVGFLADLSSVLGTGAGIAGIAGKGAELAGVADAGNIAKSAAGGLGKASELTNPLAPLAMGASALAKPIAKAASFGVSKAMGVGEDTAQIVQANKAAFTTEAINNANYTRAQVAKEVEDAFQQKEAEFSDTGAAYKPLREGSVPITVASNFLEEQLRTQAGVDVVDGQIEANAASKVRSTKDINALQQLFNTFKPAFQKGSLTPQEFFNLREDLKNVAKYDREFTASKPVESVAAAIRSKFNEAYRKDIPNLETIDQEYGSQAEELKLLRKGLFDKEGNLLESAVNKIANAGGKGKDQLLQRLEAIKPGITRKIQIQKALEDIQAATKPRVGTYAKSALEAGGILAGISTGNIHLIAGSVALAVISDPRIAVPLLKAFDFDSRLVNEVSAHLARYITLGTVTNQANAQGQGTQDTTQEIPTVSPTSDSSEQDSTQIPGYQEALNAGYTKDEIDQYLASQKP